MGPMEGPLAQIITLIMKISIQNIVVILFVAAVLGTLASISIPLHAFGANADPGTRKCTTTTSSLASVGNQNSLTLLAANPNRSYASIQQVRDSAGVATSSVSLNFAGGTAAVNSGYVLSTTSPQVTFGKNTDFAWQGAVTGITNVGSTTVQITECVFAS